MRGGVEFPLLPVGAVDVGVDLDGVEVDRRRGGKGVGAAVDFKGGVLADSAGAVPGVVEDGWRGRGDGGLGEEGAEGDGQHDGRPCENFGHTFGWTDHGRFEIAKGSSDGGGDPRAVDAGSKDSNNRQNTKTQTRLSTATSRRGGVNY